MFRLDQKIAFVTGAGSGIGEHIARLFAQQGAHVILADIRLDAAEQVAGEIRDAGGSARTQQLDVAEESQVKAAIEQAAATEGRLDILVNNAGISHVGNILETSLQDWERVMSVNARGVFLCAREGVRQMLAQSPAGGVIINMSSVAATIGIDRRLPYCASKGAVLALTRSIAIDFATRGIRCNAICPGTVQTPFVEGYLARHFAGHEDEVRQQLHARQPIGRRALPGFGRGGICDRLWTGHRWRLDGEIERPGCERKEYGMPSQTEASGPLALRPLGSTGLQVTPVCIGCAPLGNMPETFAYEVPEERALATIRAFFASPLNFLDTAASYGDGESDRRFLRRW